LEGTVEGVGRGSPGAVCVHGGGVEEVMQVIRANGGEGVREVVFRGGEVVVEDNVLHCGHEDLPSDFGAVDGIRREDDLREWLESEEVRYVNC